jgi:two-component system heavy metal sensor histidine kinase CusS
LREELKMRRAGERVGYSIRILDSAGNVVAETPEMSQRLPRDLFPPPVSLGGEPTRHRKGGRVFALMSVRQPVAGAPYTIQVAQDRSMDDQFTRRFGFILAGVIAAGIVASVVVARSVTKRGLGPLVEMTHSLERVGPTRLHERVPPAGWPRELQPLVVAFDEMLDRLEDSFTRLSQFSADLAHELRTPVANLRGEAEVALRRPRTPEEYRAVIESNVAECERLSGIIDNLLFLARAEAADRTVQRATFDGCSAVTKIADYYATLAEERNIVIECEGEGELCADPVLLGRAVSNLVENALRYTPDGGRIKIAIAQRDGHTEVSVRDNGAGIPADHLPRIFDRFYRVDSSRSSRGSGLGLALVKSIAELHGGSARVESEVEHGTTVAITLPKC